MTPARSSRHAALEMKRASRGLASVDETGVFEGYASVFGEVDLGGDIVMPGAFAQTLRSRAASAVRMLWQHEAGEPIGAWLSLIEDSVGLKARGRLNLDVARGREALALLRQGAVDGLSIGFRAGRVSRDRKSGERRIHTLELVEISIVTFPMAPQARVHAVKRASVAAAPAFARLEWLTAAASFGAALDRAR